MLEIKDIINQVHCADCLTFMHELPDKCVDLVLTDPPYEFTTGGGMVGKDRDYIDKLRDLNCLTFNPTDFLNNLKPKMKVFNGYFFCNKKLVKDYLQFAENNDYLFDILVMAKENPIPAYRGHHLSDLEYIIFIREKGSYFRQEQEDIRDFRKFYLTNCSQGFHPAEKPIDLIKRFIRVSSKQSDLILDPFLGSGTTCVAAKQLKRNFIGIEISEKYCEIARGRLRQEILL